MNWFEIYSASSVETTTTGSSSHLNVFSWKKITESSTIMFSNIVKDNCSRWHIHL